MQLAPDGEKEDTAPASRAAPGGRETATTRPLVGSAQASPDADAASVLLYVAHFWLCGGASTSTGVAAERADVGTPSEAARLARTSAEAAA